MKYLIALFLLLSFFSCKKEENTDGNPSGSNNNYSPTVYTIDFTLQDVEHHFEFGENGYGFQFSSWAFENADDVFLYASTAFNWNFDPLTTNQGSVSFSLPTCIVPVSEWNDDSAASFISYFSEAYPYVSGDDGELCTFSFTEPDGTTWSSFATSQTASTSSWTEYLHIISSSSPAEVVNGGVTTLSLYNLLEDITEEVEIRWNIRFQQPI